MPHHSRKDGRSRKLRVERLEERAMLAGDLELVKDLSISTISSDPRELVDVSGIVYFSANDGISGTELWKSDGTETGTVRVKDIHPGSAGSAVSNLANVNGTLFFRANDGNSGYELWKSDGTEAGTLRVKDISPGTGPTGFRYGPRNLTALGEVLYFISSLGGANSELWKSDGTDQGTVRVKDLRNGAVSSSVSNLTKVGSDLYFRVSDGGNGIELWKSDGTESGTSRIKSVASFNLTDVSGTLYFSGSSSEFGSGIWKSDGTEQGTVLVKESEASYNLTNVNGVLYFSADGLFGNELRKSDGTQLGTTSVLNSQLSVLSIASDVVMTNVGGTLFFSATDGVNGYELWKSNGTLEGTVRVKDIRPGSLDALPQGLTNVGGTLYFYANDGASGLELWKSDGSEAGTVLVQDIVPGSAGAFSLELNERQLANINGTLYFSANGIGSGSELWKSDGTTQGTVQVKDIATWTGSSTPKSLTIVGDTLYFIAFGNQLWKSDGTAAGTTLVKHLASHDRGSTSTWKLTNIGGVLYFAAPLAPNNGIFELWRSDGTEEGTTPVAPGVRIRNELATLGENNSSFITEVGGVLYFSGNNQFSNDFELWKSDGTTAGTVRVKDILTGTSGSRPRNLANVSGVLYFAVENASHRYSLWRSDGTEGGTVLLKDTSGGTYPSLPRNFTNVSGILYFTTSRDYGLWKSDGTAAGTVKVRQFHRESRYLTNVNGTLFFSGRAFASNYQLWKSDGSLSGTVLVENGPSNLGSSYSSTPPSGLFANVGGVLYFSTASSFQPNGELWKSDGTAAGTARVISILSTHLNSFSNALLTNLTNVGGRLYFRGNDGTNGPQLWRSDGTAAGTAPVELSSGGPLLNPTEIVPVGNRLLVAGTQTQIGAELFTRLFVPNELFPLKGDFNRNRTIDLADHTFWAANFGATTGIGLQADGNANGVVDAADYAIWRDNYTPPTNPDYNRNGLIQQSDHTFWVANFGATSGVGLQADGNGNGVVDAADYSIWRDAYIPPTAAPSVAAASAAVSTPAPLLPGPIAASPARRGLRPVPRGEELTRLPPGDRDALLLARQAAFAEWGAEDKPEHEAPPRAIHAKIAKPKLGGELTAALAPARRTPSGPRG